MHACTIAINGKHEANLKCANQLVVATPKMAASAISLLAAGKAFNEAELRKDKALDCVPAELWGLAKDHAFIDRELETLSRSKSLYQAALGAGLQRLADDFMADLLKIEEETAIDPGLTVSHVRYSLNRWCAVFQIVADVLRKVASSSFTSGKLMNHLSQYTTAGDPHVAQVFKGLLFAVHQPFFAHLTHWLAYGEIDESAREEFFITHHALLIENSGKSSRGGTESLAVLPSGGGASLRSAHLAGLKHQLASHEWTDHYAIAFAALPDRYISGACAGDVLEIGKAVRLLRDQGEWGEEGGASEGVASRGNLAAGASKPPSSPMSALRGSYAVGGLPLHGRGSSSRDASAEDARYSEHEEDDDGGGAVHGAMDDGPSNITRADSIAISRLVATLRNAPTFSSLAFEVIISRIRSVVYARLWRLLVRDGSLLLHTRALRDYLLMGRGDLFQSFVELARPLMAAVPSTSPNALQQLTRGPWAAALTAATPSDIFSADRHAGSSSASVLNDSSSQAGSIGANLQLGISGLWGGGQVTPDGTGSGGNVAGDLCLHRCSLSLLHRAVKWEPSAHLSSNAVGVANTGGNRGSSPVGRAAAGAPSGTSSAWSSWYPSIGYAAEGLSRMVKVDTAMVARGASKLAALRPLDGVEAHSMETLVLARPAAASPKGKKASAPSPARSVAGAAWLNQPLAVSQGFLVRVGASVHSAIFPSLQASDTACIASRLSETASFAVVLHRSPSGPLSLGHSSSSSASSPADVPSAGYTGVDNSLVIHVIMKRLPAAQSIAAGTGQPGRETPLGYAGSCHCRIVVAVYGPALTSSAPAATTASADGRQLLASGVVREEWLPIEAIGALEAGSDILCAASLAHSLQLAVEYTPPGAAASTGVGGRGSSGQQPLNGRLRVLTLAAPSSSPLPASVGAATATVVIDAPLTLESHLNFLSSGPGRGRAWVGCTSEASSLLSSPSATAGTSAMAPFVSLSYLDAHCYSEADDAYGSLALTYDVPWPLHIILDPPTLSLYQDFFRFVLRARGLSLALQDAWRLLMESFSHDEDAAAAAPATSAAAESRRQLFSARTRVGGALNSTSATSASVLSALDTTSASATITSNGVSAQLSGGGGKRAADPAVHARARLRVALHQVLRPVWLLRGRMAYVIDALLFHLQVDVVSGAQAQFEEAIGASTDYASVRRAHASFLSTLAAGSFLSQQSIMTVVDRLLAHADRFAALLVSRAASKQLMALVQPAPAGDREVVMELADSFAADSRQLELALRSAGGDIDTGSLLTRLSFHEPQLQAMQ